MAEERVDSQEIGDYLSQVLGQEVTVTTNRSTPGINVLVEGQLGTETEVVAKLIQRPPLNNSEQQRLVQSANILRHFNQTNDRMVPVPKPIYANGETTQLGDRTYYGLLVMEKMPGVTMASIWRQLPFGEQVGLGRVLGKVVRRIHQTTADEVALTPPISWENYVGQVRQWNEQLANDRLMDKETLQDAWQFIQDRTTQWSYRGALKLVHTDLSADNVLVWWDGEHRPAVTAILDWEWSIFGDPLYDFLGLQEELFGGDREVSEVFFQSYGINMNDFLVQDRLRVSEVVAEIHNASVGYLHHNPDDRMFQVTEQKLRQLVNGQK